MRVLLIPIERTQSNVKTGDWHAAVYKLLREKHNVIGVTRPRWGTLRGWRKVPTLLWYWFAAFVHGLFARYDIIYCMNTPSAVIGMWLGTIRHRPFIWDAGNPALFNPGKLQWLMYWIEQHIWSRASKVRMISELYRDLYADMGLDNHKMVVLPHTIDAASITTPPKVKAIHPPHLLFIGQGNTPSNQWALRFLARNARAIKKSCGAEIWATGFPIDGAESVHFLGYVDDIYQTIHEADLCVVPVWSWVPSAPVPSTRVTDFMACGKCVVTTPFLQDVIPLLQHSVNGLIAQTPEQFVGLVLYAIQHPKVRARLGNEAKRTIQEYYTWDKARAALDRLLS